MIKWLNRNICYFVDFSYRLHIWGRGSIPNFDPVVFDRAPWEEEYFTEVIIGSGIDYIGAFAFYENSFIKRIRISSTVKDIHPKAFGKFDLYDVIIGGLINSGGVLKMTAAGIYQKETKELLIGRNQKHIKLPEDTRYIGVEAFADCENLETVECPDSLQTICVGAFENCKNLKAIYRVPEKTQFERRALKGTSGVRCYYRNQYPRNRMEDAEYICVMTDYGHAKLKNGQIVFYASDNLENIDPTVLYSHSDFVDMKGGEEFILGLRRNGKVVWADMDTPEDPFAVYRKYGGYERLEGWENIREIETDGNIAAGRCADGTVFSTIAEDENIPLPGMTGIIGIKVKNGKIQGMTEDGKCILYGGYS